MGCVGGELIPGENVGRGSDVAGAVWQRPGFRHLRDGANSQSDRVPIPADGNPLHAASGRQRRFAFEYDGSRPQRACGDRPMKQPARFLASRLKPPVRRKRRGFTLWETAVSTFLVGLVLVTAATTSGTSVRMQAKAGERAKAGYLAH